MIKISNIPAWPAGRKYQISKMHIKAQIFLKIFKFWFVILIFDFCILISNSFAQTVSSTDLINNAKQYDGKTITYEGEVIGDVMARGNFAWVNLNDGNNAVGVWASKDLTSLINYKGSYKQKGDWLEAVGEFHRACPQHGGDFDIHAITLKKINSGREIREKAIQQKEQLVIYLGGLLCILLVLKKFKKI